MAGDEVPRYLSHLNSSYRDKPDHIFTDAMKREEEFKTELLSKKGKENVFQLYEELSEYLVRDATVKRNNKDLKKTYDYIKEIQERYRNISVNDRSAFLNQSYIFAHQFDAMLALSLVIVKSALLREESRGAHYKLEFPDRDDKHWLKTTIATYNPETKEPDISYRQVDIRHFSPEMRVYTHAKRSMPEIKNVPPNIKLPV